jgi:hypothetical protein
MVKKKSEEINKERETRLEKNTGERHRNSKKIIKGRAETNWSRKNREINKVYENWKVKKNVG